MSTLSDKAKELPLSLEDKILAAVANKSDSQDINSFDKQNKTSENCDRDFGER